LRPALLRHGLTATALALAACTGGHGTAPHRAELQAMVGQSGEALIRRFGQPSDTSTDQDQVFMTWRDLDVHYVQAGAGYAYDHVLTDNASTTPPAYSRFSCRTTFVVVRDRVTAFNLTGNGCS